MRKTQGKRFYNSLKASILPVSTTMLTLAIWLVDWLVLDRVSF